MQQGELWGAVLGELEVTLSKANFTTWFKDTFLISLTEGEAVIGVPTAFAKEWLEKKFSAEILTALKKQLPSLSVVSFKVAAKEQAPTLPLSPPASPPPLSPGRPFPSPLLEETLNPRYTFESFVVGNSNRLAHAAAVSCSQNLGTLHNPLFLYGGVGLGKTHLAHAIGHEVRSKHPERRVLYVDCEQFTSEFIQALRASTMDKFKKKYRDVDVFLVDDIQFLAAKEGTQEEFFHTFNALHQKGRQIVLTSDRVPKAIPQLEERLSSRFGWGLVADIQPPNLEMRMAILRNKASEKSFSLPDETVTFLAENVRSNIRELEGILNRLMGWCQLHRVSPSLEVAREVLGGFIGQRERVRLSVPQVLAVVSSFYNISLEDLLSPRRTADLVIPRQVAMFLLREELKLSYPKIGQEMGGKDHTTVMHGVSRIALERSSNERLQEDLLSLKEKMLGV